MLHWDSGIMGCGRSKPVAINISWLLCDMTEKNGGTRIFPGSHNMNVMPKNIFSPVRIPYLCPPTSMTGC